MLFRSSVSDTHNRSLILLRKEHPEGDKKIKKRLLNSSPLSASLSSITATTTATARTSVGTDISASPLIVLRQSEGEIGEIVTGEKDTRYWTCGSCTFTNDSHSDSRKCSVCDVRRTGLPKRPTDRVGERGGGERVGEKLSQRSSEKGERVGGIRERDRDSNGKRKFGDSLASLNNPNSNPNSQHTQRDKDYLTTTSTVTGTVTGTVTSHSDDITGRDDNYGDGGRKTLGQSNPSLTVPPKRRSLAIPR